MASMRGTIAALLAVLGAAAGWAQPAPHAAAPPAGVRIEVHCNFVSFPSRGFPHSIEVYVACPRRGIFLHTRGLVE